MTEEEWWRRVWEYKPYVQKILKQSGLSEDVQEEVVSDVLKRAMMAYDKADKRKLGNPSSFLSTIATNEISRAWDKVRRQREAEKEAMQEDVFEWLAPAHMWSIEELIVLESFQPTFRMLEEMGVYEVWHMIQMDGLTHREAAARMGISKTKVTSDYKKAMQVIKEHLL